MSPLNRIELIQTPQNFEPDKCEGWEWHNLKNLPEPKFGPLREMLGDGFNPSLLTLHECNFFAPLILFLIIFCDWSTISDKRLDLRICVWEVLRSWFFNLFYVFFSFEWVCSFMVWLYSWLVFHSLMEGWIDPVPIKGKLGV